MKGIIAVWKPKGPTSHDVVDEVRKLTGVKRVGHAGTLDPLAAGVLVLGIGRAATKRLHEAVAAEKEYLATVHLGMTSATDDAEGPKTKIRISEKPTRANIRKTLKGFCGEIFQVPPAYSAVKLKGQRAYALARRGQAPALKPRRVLIKDIKILSYRWPYLRLRVITGPGAYVRALARDIGHALGTGGYLAELERTRVGDFTKAAAVTLAGLRRTLATPDSYPEILEWR